MCVNNIEYDMKTLLTLLLMFFLPQCIISQPIAKWKEGSYYDLKGDRHEGLIYYDYYSFAIKFRKTPESQNVKLRPWKVQGFVLEKDSFAILKDFYYEGPNGGRHKEIMDFVQVLDTGFIKLYKHYANIQSNSGGMAVVGIPVPIDINYNWDLENYLLLRKGATSPMLVRKKNTNKFKEQMLSYFKNYPEFVSKIEADEYNWESIPLLIKEFNKHKRL